jgi:hypothetical protein
MSEHIPHRNGTWSDPQRPGNSVWFPDMNCVPQGANDPNVPRTFKKLLTLELLKPLSLPGLSAIRKTFLKVNMLRLRQGAMGVRFWNDEPDFRPFAIATVRLKQFLDTRYGSAGTMPTADKLLAARLGIGESALRQWINDNQFVWHERQDGKRIDLVSHTIHGNIPHTGGLSFNKRRHGR